ncbi:MAG: thiamine-phosphate kinase [Candidatus Melainabacteria bacterium]
MDTGNGIAPSEQQILETIAGVLEQPAMIREDAHFDVNTRMIHTTDMLVEGTHFELPFTSPEALGWKAGAVNISDIAAMGGRPANLLIALGLPPNVSLSWVAGLYRGLDELCKAQKISIIGGDTVLAPVVTIAITAVGRLPEQHTPGFRTQARPGDLVMVTGPHGLSAAGLDALRAGRPGLESSLKQAHLRPVPQVEAGLILSRHSTRHALMDSSDGLADACLKIGAASNVRIVLSQDKLPRDPVMDEYARTAGHDVWQWMYYGGEDYQLVATAPHWMAAFADHWHVVGRVEDVDGQPGACVEDASGNVVETFTTEKMYQHFAARPDSKTCMQG